MPANLSPEYKAAEASFRKSRDPRERLEWLREMLRTIPKHKGTEHLQADIKARIKDLSEEFEGGRKGGAHGGLVIFDMLIALFERAYLVAYAPKMPPDMARRWNSWEDFMREWCRRENFRTRLPHMLRGEDPEFSAYIRALAEEERP